MSGVNCDSGYVISPVSLQNWIQVSWNIFGLSLCFSFMMSINVNLELVLNEWSAFCLFLDGFYSAVTLTSKLWDTFVGTDVYRIWKQIDSDRPILRGYKRYIGHNTLKYTKHLPPP